MCLFYQRESGFPKLFTVTRIDLHFRTTSASLQLPSLQSTFGRLSHHSAHSPFASEYPGHVSTEYPKTLSRVRASRIISPSNVRHRLYTCCNTSVESSQTYQHISQNISETPRALPCISKYYPLPKHAYPEYSLLFAHITQTAYRIFKDLRIFPISLPQYSRHIGTHLRRFLLRETMHRHILRYSSSPHQSGLFIRTF
jgi:hypothetical protein